MTRYSTEVVLRPYNGVLVMLGSPGGDHGGGDQGSGNGGGRGGGAGNLDDEIPF